MTAIEFECQQLCKWVNSNRSYSADFIQSVRECKQQMKVIEPITNKIIDDWYRVRRHSLKHTQCSVIDNLIMDLSKRTVTI